MTVSRVSYVSWRNIARADLSLAGGINVLWGMNGQGKSNLLEGLYYFARGRSFRGAKDRELIRFGDPFASVSVAFRREGRENDTVLEAVLPPAGKKRLTRNGAPLSSPAEMMGSFRAVLFCPANLSLVSGSPADRRTFLDIALSQLSPSYLSALRRYTKLLQERNALLRLAADGHPVSSEEWLVYAEAMGQSGAYVAACRAEYCRLLAVTVEAHFTEMTGGAERPRLVYTSHSEPDGSAALLLPSGETPDAPSGLVLSEKLTASVEREIAAGTTLWGVHKDDLVLTLNDREAKLYASQGQQRSLALAMKLGEAQIARDVDGESPVILLDDVFSELDEQRRHYILDSLSAGERQIVITSCEPDVIPGSREDICFRHVENGMVNDA